MKKFLGTRPTAEVAGAEYLANAMAKWPDFAQRRSRRPAADAAPTAVVAGIEYRASANRHQWPGLLTWRQGT